MLIFFIKSIKYLGHVISERKIQVDPDRIKAIVNLPAPTDVKGLRRFIGMVQFCHKFVKNLNTILAPLYDLLKNNRKFVWSGVCQNNFDKLKHILTSAPILYSPTADDRFILESDASDIGLGGCLKALDGNGNEVIVGYCSKKFVNNEISWNIVEKEAFAILHNVRNFHHYLIGRPFTIRCDNRVVCYLRDKRNPRIKKLLNWALELSEYDYAVEHISSKNNNISDCLSRLSVTSIAAISDLGDLSLSKGDFISEQDKDTECAAAKSYVNQGKMNFDVNLLGSLKRQRKHLNLSGRSCSHHLYRSSVENEEATVQYCE